MPFLEGKQFVAVLAFPSAVQEDQGMLIWLTSLVPAFLLAYYRGLRGVALAVAGGMAVLALTQVTVLLFGRAAPNWTLLLVIVAVYVGVCIALAIFAEVLHRERQAAEELALVDVLTGLPNRRHSDREYHVLCAFGAGKCIKDIAAELGISPKTVSTYRARILQKLNLKTNLDLVRYVIQHGLVG